MDAQHCWRCGKDSPAAGPAPSLFCQFCNTLQPPVPDYFRFFGFPKQLNLDAAELQKRFYALSRQLHPDHYTRAQDRERSFSLEGTAILNDGYRILRDPVQRAEYVLKENGFDIGEQRSKDVPPELLEEVFELNMALDELRSGDDDALPQLQNSRATFTDLLADVDGGLGALFQRHDEASTVEDRRAALADIRGVLNRRRYIENLLREVDKELTARQA